MLFGPICCPSPNIGFGSLSLYLRDCVTNLAIKFEFNLKFEKQNSSVVEELTWRN